MKNLTLEKARELLEFLKGKAASGDITISQENYLQAVELAVMVLEAREHFPLKLELTSMPLDMLERLTTQYKLTRSDLIPVNFLTEPKFFTEPKWIPCKKSLPEKRQENYQVAALCAKKYEYGNYAGLPKRTIVQDWVIRSWPLNFTHWMPLPANPEPEAL